MSLTNFITNRLNRSLKENPQQFGVIRPRPSAPKVWHTRYKNYIQTYGVGLELAYADPTTLKVDFENVEKDVNSRIDRNLPPRRLSNNIKKALLAQRERRWDEFLSVARQVFALPSSCPLDKSDDLPILPTDNGLHQEDQSSAVINPARVTENTAPVTIQNQNKMSKILLSLLQERVRLAVGKDSIPRIKARPSSPEIWHKIYDEYVELYGFGLELPYADSQCNINLVDAKKDLDRRILQALPPRELSPEIRKAFKERREQRWDTFVDVLGEISDLANVAVSFTWKVR